jgi:hypothetical protein
MTRTSNLASRAAPRRAYKDAWRGLHVGTGADTTWSPRLSPMRVRQGNPPWAVSGSAMGMPVSNPPWAVSGSAISACVLYHHGNCSKWAARYGRSAIPPLMGHPGLLLQDYVAGIPIWYIPNIIYLLWSRHNVMDFHVVSHLS